MEEIVWLRYINIVLSVIALLWWAIYYIKYNRPIAFAPIAWLVLNLALVIFRLFTGPDPKYYFIVTTWSSIMRMMAISLLIAAAYIYRPIKKE
jgi:hypothetical protein